MNDSLVHESTWDEVRCMPSCGALIGSGRVMGALCMTLTQLELIEVVSDLLGSIRVGGGINLLHVCM